jgi:peptidoglycan/xylan/chitin deacetylase (PgdA/CDA1 family)
MWSAPTFATQQAVGCRAPEFIWNAETVLKSLKRSTLAAARGAGIMSFARESAWRRRRLLILGYHGVSTLDEHEWDGELYMPPSLLRERFEALRRGRYQVLPLGEALARLYDGSLPPRAVAITFDDGAYDFFTHARPLLEEFAFPATVYLTSYYSRYQRPVFNTMLRYLFWKARDKTLATTGLTNDERPLALTSNEARAAAFAAVAGACAAREMSGAEKDSVLATVAGRLAIDYDGLLRRRFLHLMAPDEVARLPHDLIDVQLHTHRHRVPTDETRFEREILENRREITVMTGADGAQVTHFCYPSGVTNPSFPGWLRKLGVVSATTCFPGIASAESDPLMLPRLIDTVNVSAMEFEGWLTGTSAFLPRRRVYAAPPI